MDGPRQYTPDDIYIMVVGGVSAPQLGERIGITARNASKRLDLLVTQGRLTREKRRSLYSGQWYWFYKKVKPDRGSSPA